MTKSEMLTHWEALAPDAPILPHLIPLAQPKGSTFGACGIRIDGSPAFVDAVLSRLKDMIDGENHLTRLSCSYSPATGDFKATPNAVPNAQVCYIRLHERTLLAAGMSARCDRRLDGPTQRYSEAMGIAEEESAVA